MADPTEQGKAQIRYMLGISTYTLRVNITLAARVTKTDTRWFDAYLGEPKDEYLDAYWRSEPFKQDDAAWEYLVEGLITAIEKSELDYIRAHGAHRTLMAQPPSHP